MSLFMLGGPKLQLFNNEGHPLAGGTLECYAAGTSTPLDTYSDSEGVTENEQPVEMDAAGRTGS